MKIITTFWTDEVFEFKELLYINGNTGEIVFRADLSDVYATHLFFKDISRFVKSPMVLKSYDTADFYQFAVYRAGEICPVKWFDFVVSADLVISLDIAFETTLIKKNGVDVHFGKFPMWVKGEVSKYREFKMKSRVYKYLANVIGRGLLFPG